MDTNITNTLKIPITAPLQISMLQLPRSAFPVSGITAPLDINQKGSYTAGGSSPAVCIWKQLTVTWRRSQPQVTACPAEVWGQAHATSGWASPLEPPSLSPAHKTWRRSACKPACIRCPGNRWASAHSNCDLECHGHANSVGFSPNSSLKLHKIT